MTNCEAGWEWDTVAAGMLTGDQSAYVAFSRLCGPMLRRLFCIKGLRYREAEELALTCVTDIALKVEKFNSRGPGSFRGWVLRLATNLLVDYYRRTRRGIPASPIPLDVVDETDQALAPRAALVLAVRRAIEHLDATDREIVLRHELGDGTTLAEIGRALGLSPAGVRARHHRAKKRLESLLSADIEVARWLGQRKTFVIDREQSDDHG
jgi:RNA polymerase sigma factor (sigma-70 family)